MFKLPKWLRSIWGLLIPSPWRTGDIATFPSRYGGLSRCENASWISILKLWLNFSMVQLRFLYFLRFVENSCGCKVKFDKVWFIWERFAFSGFSFYFSEGSNIKKNHRMIRMLPQCVRVHVCFVSMFVPTILPSKMFFQLSNVETKSIAPMRQRCWIDRQCLLFLGSISQASHTSWDKRTQLYNIQCLLSIVEGEIITSGPCVSFRCSTKITAKAFGLGPVGLRINSSIGS